MTASSVAINYIRATLASVRAGKKWTGLTPGAYCHGGPTDTDLD